MDDTRTESDHLEHTIERMGDVIDSLIITLGNLLIDLDPYYEGYCIVCGCPQPDQKHKHEHHEDCAFIAAQKEWQSYQPPDDGR